MVMGIKQWARLGMIAPFAATMGLLEGCTTPLSGDVYTPRQAQREQTVRLGTVESVRMVTIREESTTGLGAIGGGAAGAVAGNALGGGRGALLTGIAGGLAGIIAGQAVERGLGKQNGIEITVRLTDGTLRAVTQSAAPEIFRVGDRVRLLSSGGTTRVSH